MRHRSAFLVLIGAALVFVIACRGGAGTGGRTTIPVFTPTPAPQVCQNSTYPAEAPQFGDDEAIAYTFTESGLGILTRTEGDGDAPGPDSTVLVQYTGFLPDGCIFDTSRRRSGPTTFQIRQLIDGMSEGILAMRQGGSSRLRIPAELAYGPFGIPGVIPPNSAIIFEVELVEVDPEPEESATSTPPTLGSATSTGN